MQIDPKTLYYSRHVVRESQIFRVSMCNARRSTERSESRWKDRPGRRYQKGAVRRRSEESAAYLRSWLTSIQDDPQAFYNAATDADKICKYISTNYLAEEKENKKEEVKVDEVKPSTVSSSSNDMTFEKKGEDYKIRYSGIAWGLSTSDLPNDVREAAVWLIENGYQNDEGVQRAFYDRMTSEMSDDPHAEKNDNEAIKREYQSRRGACRRRRDPGRER